MSFCQHFFGKEIDKVEFQDVDNLLKRPDLESTFLECKSCDDHEVKSKKYALSIAGFLNTDGGLLIIGTPRQDSKTKQFQSNFTFHSRIDKDHLRDRLIGSIEPLPKGVQIETVKKDGKDDQCVTLVDVPQSEYPPHQCQGTYYVRLDGANKPAPHGLVEAMFNGKRPRHQQALIEHFERKLGRIMEDEKAMTILYFLVLENRLVPGYVIYWAVTGSNRPNVASQNILADTLERLTQNLGLLVFEVVQGKESSYESHYLGSTKYSINPDYRDLLKDVVFKRHREKPFHLNDV